MPFDSPGVGFIMLPRSSGRAGSSFPRLRGARLIYKTLKLVLLQEGETGDGGVSFSHSTTPTDTSRAWPINGGPLGIYTHGCHERIKKSLDSL